MSAVNELQAAIFNALVNDDDIRLSVPANHIIGRGKTPGFPSIRITPIVETHDDDAETISAPTAHTVVDVQVSIFTQEAGNTQARDLADSCRRALEHVAAEMPAAWALWQWRWLSTLALRDLGNDDIAHAKLIFRAQIEEVQP